MKILFLGGYSSRSAAGIFHIMTQMGRHLLKIPGTEVHFLLTDDKYSEEDRSYFEGMHLHIYKTYGPGNLNFSLEIQRKIAEIKPDVIHVISVWLFLAFANNRYHAETKTPYLISPQGMLDPWQLKQTFVKDAVKKVALLLYERKHLNNAACIHVLNQMEYDAIRDFNLVNPAAIIPNATRLPEPKELVAKPNSAPWPVTNRKTLLFLSRIHVKKGLDNLIKAWALTKPATHNWQLVIAGETEDKAYWNKLKSEIKSLGIEETALFIGAQYDDAKTATFANADAFVLPSFSEGLPMAVLEAWSFKLPAVITEYCYIPEGFEAGAAIRIGTDPEEIATGIHTLISLSPERLVEMGEAGYNLVEEKFTWSSVAARFHEVYQWMLGKTAQPPSIVER